MNIDPVRLEKQEAFMELWRSNKGRGTLEASTGFGKTFAAILICQKYLSKNPEAEILISVPTRALKEQWKVELEAHGVKAKILIINTLIVRNRTCDLLILDEIHNTGAPTFSRVFKRVEYKHILGLTATIKRQDGMEEMIGQYAPVLMNVSQKDAERNKFISRLIIYNLGISLPEEGREFLRKLDAEIDSLFNFFEGNYTLINAVLSGGMIGVTTSGKYVSYANAPQYKAIFHFSKAKQMDPSIVIGLATKYMKKIGERKKFLYEHPEKLKVAKEIIERFDDKSIITFSQSITFSKKLDTLTKQSFFYDSKNTKSFNNARIQGFKEGNYRIIHAVKALDEGLNIPSLDMAINLAGTAQPRQFIQRVGRIVRQQEGKTAIMVDVFIRGSQEEKWLRSRQRESKKAVEISSVKEISLNPTLEVQDYGRLFKS